MSWATSQGWQQLLLSEGIISHQPPAWSTGVERVVLRDEEEEKWPHWGRRKRMRNVHATMTLDVQIITYPTYYSGKKPTKQISVE